MKHSFLPERFKKMPLLNFGNERWTSWVFVYKTVEMMFINSQRLSLRLYGLCNQVNLNCMERLKLYGIIQP